MLKKQYTIQGWQVRLNGIRIKGYNKIAFSLVYLQNRRGDRIQLQQACLLIDLKRLFRLKQLRHAVKGGRPAKIAADAQPYNWEASAYPKLTGFFRLLFNLPVKKIEAKAITAGFAFAGLPVQLRIDEFSLLINAGSHRIDMWGSEGSIGHQERQVLQIAQYAMSCEIDQQEAHANMSLTGTATGIQTDHPAFSSMPVRINKAEAEAAITISRRRFELKKETAFAIDDLPVSFSLIHDAQEADLVKCTVVYLIEGAHFFTSYPFFDDKAFKEIKAVGEHLVQLDYLLSLSDYSNYYFNATVVKSTLQVTDFGPFFVNNKQLAADYLPLNSIPCWLVKAVVAAEDPNFYKHSGIDPYFIGIATAINLLSRRFKKGASTITMQLSKNLFFQHNKCITRKLNEMIVAWLLENHLKLSKEKILGIYLNIIEFAEGVYGIQAAAEFYFNKEVSRLAMLECITLSYIIPRPKFFLDALLTRSVQLMSNLRKHLGYHARKLLEEGTITEQEFNSVDYTIHFELPALGNKKITLQW